MQTVNDNIRNRNNNSKENDSDKINNFTDEGNRIKKIITNMKIKNNIKNARKFQTNNSYNDDSMRRILPKISYNKDSQNYNTIISSGSNTSRNKRYDDFYEKIKDSIENRKKDEPVITKIYRKKELNKEIIEEEN